jgi:3-dehydroshikimate dehydratase
MMKLTGFGDEISPDLTEQLDVLESAGINYLDFRSVWGKSLVELNEHEIAIIKEELDKRRFRVSSIASPIGKTDILEDFSSQLNDLDKVITLAKTFDTAYIRVFSYFIPQGENPYTYREVIINKTKALVKKAETKNVILLHENEKGIYGDIPERCLDLLTEVDSPNYRAIFDIANFVQSGVRPFIKAYPLLKPYLEYVHIKDARFSDSKVVLPGLGDGEVEELLTQLMEDGYNGFLSIEHHLGPDGEFEGCSNSKLFQQAAQALNSVLSNIQAKGG